MLILFSPPIPLVEEYLVYNGYLNTASVFRPESGTLNANAKHKTLGRAVMAHELGVADTEAGARVPLLYSAVAKLKRTATDAVHRGRGNSGIIASNPINFSAGAIRKSQSAGSSRAASPTSGLFGVRSGSRAASSKMVAAAPMPASSAARVHVPEEMYEYSSDDALEESYVSRSGREIMFAV